ncbi:MAG: hypothetical protein JRN58_02140 [Nitrososphaerota archaeon]|nr:hypothetical protein [Nitrososphaerota archaeon]
MSRRPARALVAESDGAPLTPWANRIVRPDHPAAAASPTATASQPAALRRAVGSIRRSLIPGHEVS